MFCEYRRQYILVYTVYSIHYTVYTVYIYTDSIYSVSWEHWAQGGYLAPCIHPAGYHAVMYFPLTPSTLLWFSAQLAAAKTAKTGQPRGNLHIDSNPSSGLNLQLFCNHKPNIYSDLNRDNNALHVLYQT